MKVTIIDYGMGNLASVANALRSVGGEPERCSQPDELGRAERVVLPGVGAFGDAMARLTSTGWIDALSDAVLQRERPVLGLCLGMQLLFTTGTEHGRHDGLGWLDGTVERLVPEGDGCRVPHMGWNDVDVRCGRLYRDLDVDPTFYFVHSYVCVPDDPAIVTGTVRYGGDWVASVERDHIHATQFHPEKSHRAGLGVLARFLAA